MATVPEYPISLDLPTIGNCYGITKYSHYMAKNPRDRYSRKYFSTIKPTYLGKCTDVQEIEVFDPDGSNGFGSTITNINCIFNNNDEIKEIRVNFLPVTGNTLFFVEMRCPEPSNENKLRKKGVLNNLKTLPPKGPFPGGINYQNARDNFEAGKTRKSRKSRKSRK